MKRITYFELRGRAEPARLMLHAAGVDFEDHRVGSAEEGERVTTKPLCAALPTGEWGADSVSLNHASFRLLAALGT